jgi:hypothetical protein
MPGKQGMSYFFILILEIKSAKLYDYCKVYENKGGLICSVTAQIT